MNIQNEIEKWDAYYSQLPVIKEDPLIAEINVEFSKLITSLMPSGGKSLELGCGAGWQSLALARTGKFEVTLLDFSAQALQYAKALFEQQGVKAETILRNGFEPGAPDFDLVFNAGVLEHYPLKDQIELLKSMASYSRKYVLVLIPNQQCYWYWIWRTKAASEANWPFGQEIPLKDVAIAFQQAGITYLGQAYFGETWTESLISSITGLEPSLRRSILEVHRNNLIPIEQRAYLIAALGQVGVPTGEVDARVWRPVAQPTPYETSQYLSALSDALALNLKSQNEMIGLRNELVTASEKLSSATTQLNEIYKSRSWKLAQGLRKARLAVLPVDSGLSELLRNLGKGKKNVSPEIHQFRAQIDQILQKHAGSGDVIVYPPSIQWDIELFQRPQQMALSFAKAGNLVFYCQPVGVDPRYRIQQAHENLYITNVPMESFSQIENPVVIAVSYNRKWLGYFSKPRIVYDYIDELEVFKDALDINALRRNHRYFLKHATIISATAANLFEEVHRTRKDALLIPNGVDYEHFQGPFVSQLQANKELEKILAQNKPIVGYYGALARWFDYELLEKTASARPDLSFVLIGPNYDNSMTTSTITELPNVYWLGPKKYSELPAYLTHFTVCMIPFVVNDITHSTSPLKLFEYMAARKPVVITPMRESMRIEGVLVANDPQQFSEKIDEAIRLSNDRDFTRRLDEIARENTWDARAQQVTVALHPERVGPQFRQNLQVYIHQQAANVPEETRQMWLDFAQQSNQRGFLVCERVKRHVSLANKAYLDIGCAYGGFLIAFNKNGCESVTGIDLNNDLLDLARINLSEHGVKGRLELLSVESDDFLNLGKFDIATCNDVIEHVDHPDLTLQQIASVLNPGGLAYFEIPNPFWPGFLAKDGHYNLPGITLLSREDAAQYFKMNYDAAYGVGHYHTLNWYLERLSALGLKPQWVLNPRTAADELCEQLRTSHNQMIENLEKVKISPALKNKIIQRSELLSRYCLRRKGQKKELRTLQAMFGVDFWTVVAFKPAK